MSEEDQQEFQEEEEQEDFNEDGEEMDQENDGISTLQGTELSFPLPEINDDKVQTCFHPHHGSHAPIIRPSMWQTCGELLFRLIQ